MTDINVLNAREAAKIERARQFFAPRRLPDGVSPKHVVVPYRGYYAGERIDLTYMGDVKFESYDKDKK